MRGSEVEAVNLLCLTVLYKIELRSAMPSSAAVHVKVVVYVVNTFIGHIAVGPGVHKSTVIVVVNAVHAGLGGDALASE